MGIGDEVMVTAHAHTLAQSSRRPVIVVDRFGRPRTHELWLRNPNITSVVRNRSVRLLNAPGFRPYIAGKNNLRWQWNTGTTRKPGELFFDLVEKEFAELHRGSVVIEPHTKVRNSNKAWSWSRWVEVALALSGSGYRLRQLGLAGTQTLPGVELIQTNVRQACAVLSTAKLFIGTEGGLHHVCAAVGTPAVILWSEFISPEVTGYSSQRNIRHAGTPCGARLSCTGCYDSMQRITVDEVLTAIKENL